MRKPILSTEAERLLFYSLMELTEHFGSNVYKPLSLSLLCLLNDVTSEEKDNIIYEFQKIVAVTAFDDLTLDLFEDILKRCTDMVVTESTVKSFVKACANCYAPELIPFSKCIEQ